MERPTANSEGALLVPGRTCWRVEQASRLAFLVDGAACFGAMRAAMAAARHSIYVLAWDLDSRMRLVPGGAGDGLPDELGAFFDALARRRRGLDIRLLSWDYAMLYALEREWMPKERFGERTHRRVSFALDGRHPVGASHHQKIVVVDDRVAFVGGFDLTRCRWDTPAHRGDEPARCDAAGTRYGPFHDVHAIVEGDAARAIGDLARGRWRDAVGETCAPAPPDLPSPWPAGLAADAEGVPVGIVRTVPALESAESIEEFRALIVEAIGAARQSIFAEAQYFTADAVGRALAARLSDDGAPDVAVVTSRTQSGWLEEKTMGVLRARLHRALRAVDHAHRYRAFYPDAAGLDGCINVHSKVVAIDDRLLVLGSANLNNRSMGVDTECCIALDAALDQRLAAPIASLRNRLLAEHLGRDEGAVAAAIASEGGLLAAIDALRTEADERTHARTLVPIEFEVSPEVDALVPEQAVLDPEHPLEPERILADVVPDRRRVVARRIAIGTGVVVAVGALLAVWMKTPLREWIDVAHLVGLMNRLGDSPIAPVVMIAAYLVGGFFAFPVNVLISVTVIVFGPILGALYALIGAVLNAIALYEVGRRVGRGTLLRWTGPKFQRLGERLERRGLLAIVVVRIVPVAPYSVVNLISGAMRIRRRDYLIGTALGMLPGIVLNALFIDRAIAAIRHPGPLSYALLALAAAVVVGTVVFIRRRMARAAALEAG